MFLDADDARSDFILAAAVAVLGHFVVYGFLARLPLYPGSGRIGLALDVAWVFALTGLVPVLLARYRKQGAAAFGLDEGRGALPSGVVLAVPVAILGFLELWTRGIPMGLAALGTFGILVTEDPIVLLLQLLLVVSVFVGTLLLYTFATVRARDGFRRNELSQVEALRTYGMGSVGVALVLGLLNSVRPGISPAATLRTVVALLVVVLLADRLVPAGRMTSRATVLAPAAVAFVIVVFRQGGFFRNPNLLGTLYFAALAAGVALVIAVLVDSRERAWAVVPLVAALAIYPTPLLPV